MDLRQLRYFLAIVEEGSITNAARKVKVAQPALSLHLRTMEETLGTTLLRRGPKGVMPTEEGALLAARARTLLADLQQAQDEIRAFGKEPAGVVRLGLPGTIGDILSVPLITRCRERYPKIKIIVAEAMSGFVRDWLLARSVELAVIYTDLEGATVASEALIEEELVLLMPPDRKGRDKFELASLASETLILPSEAHGLRIMLDKVFAANGVSVEPAIELDSYRSIKQLVEDGYGCSILPLHAVAREELAGSLAIRRFTNLTRKAYLIQNISRPTTRATATVRQVLEDVVGELIDTNHWAGARHLEADPP